MVWKNKYLLVSTIRIISLIIISIHFFSLFICLFIYCFFFLTECQATCFKNSSYVFSKSGRIWSYNWGTCLNQGGYLVSIETEEEWRFITHEIQKRGTWNTSAWHIGLVRKDGVWIWQTGQQLNISKWRDSKQDGKKIARKYPRMKASLIVSLGLMKTPSFARYPEVRSHSHH